MKVILLLFMFLLLTCSDKDSCPTNPSPTTITEHYIAAPPDHTEFSGGDTVEFVVKLNLDKPIKTVFIRNQADYIYIYKSYSVSVGDEISLKIVPQGTSFYHAYIQYMDDTGESTGQIELVRI